MSLAVLAILGIVTVIGYVRDNWDAIWGQVLEIWNTISGGILRAYESNLGWLLPGGFLIMALLFLQNNWERIWGGILQLLSDRRPLHLQSVPPRTWVGSCPVARLSKAFCS